ncbi:hypothetical protein SAZ11_57235 [Streptomyces sp. FXJ1.4098]|nr:hypothetical protein [Streptomyces sp. FXJ1.4098]
MTASDAPDLAALLHATMLCNDAALEPPPDDDTPWRAMGDPTEAALLTAGARLGLDRSALESELPRVSEIPFDSARKRMTTVHRTPGGGLRIVCKGAPEAVLRPTVLTDAPDLLSQAAARAEELARGGYRVLAVASRDRQGPQLQGPDTWETGLSLLGLVGILDPPRDTSRTTVAACERAGITPVLITGDHPLTHARWRRVPALWPGRTKSPRASASARAPRASSPPCASTPGPRPSRSWTSSRRGAPRARWWR